jgi:hypothetical protein
LHKSARLAREKLEQEALVQRLADQAAAEVARFKQQQAAGFKSAYEQYRQKLKAEKAERERSEGLERAVFAEEIAPADAPDAANAATAPADAADALADALLDALVAARVPKGTLDTPVRSHADRLPSSTRGMQAQCPEMVLYLHSLHACPVLSSSLAR